MRRLLNAAAVATVSALALISFQAIFRTLAQEGRRPQRIRSKVVSCVSWAEGRGLANPKPSRRIVVRIIKETSDVDPE